MTDWWQNRPWRLIQTNLREIDMRDIRAEQVVADLQAFKANGLMINAAGIIASYPTQLPFQFQSPYLTGDSLQQIITACHAADIRVIARTDFSKVRRPIYEAHPDWAYRTRAGDIVDYNGDVHACLNGPYQQEYALRIIEELLSTHDFDGIFFNMGGYQTHDYSGNYYGLCHCANCQRRFQALYGLALPDKEDMADPVYRRYTEFKQRTVKELGEKVYRFIAEGWPQVCIANHTDFRRGFIRQESNTALDRPLPHWQYSASDNTKWAVGSYPEMVSSNTTVDFIDFPNRHAAVSPHQQALRLVQSLANGGALDYYLIGRLDNHEDRSGYAAIQDIFHYHAAHEKAYQGLRSLANVALLKPAQGGEGEYRGWFRVLTENHFLFDVLTLDAAPTQPLARYQAIIVPGIEALSDALATRLDGFANAGGTLIAVGQSGFRDERAELRQAPALKSLGIEQVLTVRNDMRSSYFKIDAADQNLRGLGDPGGFKFLSGLLDATSLIYMDSAYIYARYAPNATPCLKLIPPHKFGPPERCYYEQVTDHPGFVVNPFGQGKAIYLPWTPGALFHRQGHTNTAGFLAALLQSAAGLRPVGGNLPPQVEVTQFEKQDGSAQLIHLVNGSGHFGNTFYAPLPTRDVQVAVPCPRRPKAVHGLRTEQALPFSWADDRLSVQVPELGLFEAIEVESGD
jgi:hypothetical protein